MIGRTNSSGVMPQGTITLTTNGSHDVASYSEAIVSVSGVTPTGTLQISSNGVYDVASYASAEVNITTPTTEPTVLDMLCKNVTYVNDPSGILSDNITITNFGSNPISYFSTTGTGSFYINSYTFASTPNLSLIDLTNATYISVSSMAFWQRNIAGYSNLTFKGVVKSAQYAAFMGARLSGTIYISWNQAMIPTSCFSNNNLTSIDWTITSTSSFAQLAGLAGNINLQSIYTHPTSFSSFYLDGAVFQDCRSSPMPAYFLERMVSIQTTIFSYAFRQCYGITTLSKSHIMNINEFAFDTCTSLASVYLTTGGNINIGQYAFSGCTSLSIFEVTNTTSLLFGSFAFRDCANLSIISAPNCTKYYFRDRCLFATNIKSFVISSGSVNLSSRALTMGNNIKYISLPTITTVIANSAFAGNSNLSFLNCRNITGLNSMAIYQCSQLKSLLFVSIDTINGSAMYGCQKLSQLYVLTNIVPTMTNRNALIGTPISSPTGMYSSYGSIYVKASMLDAFKAATTWTAYSDRMVGLTDAEVTQAITDYDNTPYVPEE